MVMDKLEWDWVQTQKHNRDGSFSTQSARRATLSLSARQLRELGYRNLRADRVAQKHLRALVGKWKGDGLSPATIKNRMAHLRWACEKAGRPGVAGLRNDDLGIERRQYIARESRATALTVGALQQVHDRHIQFSLRLQAEFGLRREEAIKFRVAVADRGTDRIALAASWCKGGRAREILIRTPEQKALLRELHDFCGTSSLIPAHLSYAQQLKRYEYQTNAAGLHKNHGLRHLYAQTRYLQLTGRQCPAVQRTLSTQAHLVGGENGWFGQVIRPIPQLPEGLTSAGLDDRDARQTITEELGHGRISITNSYLGSTRG
nr:phage integrase N-terminal domain-containing protein [Pseudomonas aeruginosa]